MARLTTAKGAVSARSADESHRAATPLELLFDLCFVVALAQAGREFSTAVIHDQIGHGLLSYATIFFAIWWPWMNYSWFASGFDPDDGPFRLATFAQITGVPRAGSRTGAGGLRSAETVGCRGRHQVRAGVTSPPPTNV
ncbi:low temperature requirement protein A [Streptomyces sp. NPDC046821]|uniref:low temperature requirement protein A n=1 Tax=Streptomyces sp. NPDC046821 TaxID=3154702 RepID=UPI0033FB647D